MAVCEPIVIPARAISRTASHDMKSVRPRRSDADPRLRCQLVEEACLVHGSRVLVGPQDAPRGVSARCRPKIELQPLGVLEPQYLDARSLHRIGDTVPPG